MKKINLYLSDTQYAALTRLRAHTDITMAEWIRRALDAFLREQTGLQGMLPPAPATSTED